MNVLVSKGCTHNFPEIINTFYVLIPELITTQQMTKIHRQKTLSKPRQPVACVLLKNSGTLS